MREKLLFLLLAVILLTACNDDMPEEETHEEVMKEADCLFDLDEQDDSFLKDKPEFSQHTWDKETKQAVISLPHEDTIVVHRGGCKVYSVSATLKTRQDSLPPFSDSKYWFEKARWLAGAFFDPGNAAFVDSALSTIKVSKKENGITTEYQIPHPRYEAFYLRLDSLPPLRMVTIGYVQQEQEEE